MKSIIFIVLIVLGTVVLSSAEDALSEKEAMRLNYKYDIPAMYGLTHVSQCPIPLNPDQQDILAKKIEEFGRCCNTTIDTLFDKLDADIKQTDFRDLAKANKYIPQFCGISDGAMNCFRNLAPSLKLCASENEKVFLDSVITIAPMVFQSGCLQNGTRLLELLQHGDGVKCVRLAYDWLASANIGELLFSKPRDLNTECVEYKHLQTEVAQRLDECSSEVFNLAKPLLGQFCKATQCQEYNSDLNCY